MRSAPHTPGADLQLQRARTGLPDGDDAAVQVHHSTAGRLSAGGAAAEAGESVDHDCYLRTCINVNIDLR